MRPALEAREGPVSARLIDTVAVIRCGSRRCSGTCCSRQRRSKLGHAGISTTLNIYMHVVDASHRRGGRALRAQPIANPLGPRCCLCARHDLLPVQSEWTRYWPQIWTHVSLPIGHFARPSAKATIGSRACRFALARTPPDQRRRGYKVHPRTSTTARRHRHSRDLDLCPRVLLRMDFQIRAECSSNRARSLRAGRPLRVHRQPGMNEQAMAALASPPFYEARRLQLADDWGILCR